MGIGHQVTCKKCGHEFYVREGGGFTFHLLHCDQCGKDKSVGFNKIGEAHVRYLKGLKVPYSIATEEFDKHVQENYDGKPISEKEYYAIIETLAGHCRCGGKYTFNAPSRCPKCKSAELKESPKGDTCYD